MTTPVLGSSGPGEQIPTPRIRLCLPVAFAAWVDVVSMAVVTEASPLAALAWIFGGAWLAAHSWRRALHLLDQLDDAGGLPGSATPEAIAHKAATRAGWDRRDAGATSAVPEARG